MATRARSPTLHAWQMLRAQRRDVPMLALIAIPVVCWLCALLATPQRPCPYHEIQEFVHRRLVEAAVHRGLCDRSDRRHGACPAPRRGRSAMTAAETRLLSCALAAMTCWFCVPVVR